MIIDAKTKWIETPKGWHGFAMSSLRDLMMVPKIFYNLAIPLGLSAG